MCMRERISVCAEESRQWSAAALWPSGCVQSHLDYAYVATSTQKHNVFLLPEDGIMSF